jgi:large subunit ribosomal protein L3
MRTGLVGTKIGMTRVFDLQLGAIPVTVIKLDPAVVNKIINNEHNDNIQIGVLGEVKKNKIKKTIKGQYKKSKATVRKKLVEFKIAKDAAFESGQILTVKHFVVGQYVDVQSRSIGKGFAGVMKRHNFAGLEASHGVSISHRAQGSTGQCQDPGKVFKGKKMAGQMGDKIVTIQSLKVIKVEPDENLILIKGSVPGKNGAIVKITDAIKKPLADDIPYPTYKRTEESPREVELPEKTVDPSNEQEISKEEEFASSSSQRDDQQDLAQSNSNEKDGAVNDKNATATNSSQENQTESK